MAISGQETIMRVALAALKASPTLVPNIRRVHRVPVTRENSPAVYLIDGDDKPANDGKRCGGRVCGFRTAVIVRDDLGPEASDPYKVEIMRRFGAYAWPSGVSITPGPIDVETEEADSDATQVVMFWTANYHTDGEWSLVLA